MRPSNCRSVPLSIAMERGQGVRFLPRYRIAERRRACSIMSMKLPYDVQGEQFTVAAAHDNALASRFIGAAREASSGRRPAGSNRSHAPPAGA
jgi:hypothetical protein